MITEIILVTIAAIFTWFIGYVLYFVAYGQGDE